MDNKQKSEVFKNLPLEELQKYGVGKEQLSQPGVKEALLLGEKTPRLTGLKTEIYGEPMMYSASFQLLRKPDTSIGVIAHGPKQEEKLSQQQSPDKKESNGILDTIVNKFTNNMKTETKEPALKEPITAKQIPYKRLEEIGIDKSKITPEIKEALLSGKKTPLIENLQVTDGNGKIADFSGKVKLYTKDDFSIGVQVFVKEDALKVSKKEGIAPEQKLENSFQSIMQKKAEKIDSATLGMVKPDQPVIAAIKEASKQKVQEPSIDNTPAKKINVEPALKKTEEAGGDKKTVKETTGVKNGSDPISASEYISRKQQMVEAQGKLTPEEKVVKLNTPAIDPPLKKKPEKPEYTEVLGNKTWATNFYHNYVTAVNKVDSEKNKKYLDVGMPVDTLKAEKKESKVGIGADGKLIDPSLHQSIMQKRGEKLDPMMLKTLTPDFPVITAYKEVIKEKQEKSLTKSTDLPQEVKQNPVKETVANNSLSAGQKDMAPKKGDLFSVTELPYDLLKKHGITQSMLVKPGVVDNLLKGENTIPVNNLKMKEKNGNEISYASTFRLERKEDGSVGLKMDYVKGSMEIGFAKKIAEGVKNAVNAVKPKSEGEIKGENFKIPEKIKEVTLSKDQQQLLKEGKPIHLSGMKTSSGETFAATVQVNAKEGKLGFKDVVPLTNMKVTPELKDKDKVAESKGQKVENPIKETEKQDRGIKIKM